MASRILATPMVRDKDTIAHTIVSLDLIRGLAAFAVVLGHVRVSTLVEYAALPPSQHNAAVAGMLALTRFGREAVLAFFILSGFLVCGAIIRRVQQGRFDVASYAIERATRIFVPLVPACIFAAIVQRLVLPVPIDFGQLVSNMLGLNGLLTDTLPTNVPLWTLAYEVWFYVVGGAAGYILYARRASVSAVAALGCGIAVFCVLAAHYLLFWVLGGLMVTQFRAANRKLWAAAGALIFLLGVALHQFAIAGTALHAVILVPERVSEFLICGGLALALPFICDDEINLRLRPLQRPALVLSEISFSLYLFHYPTNLLLDRIFPRSNVLDWTGVSIFFARLTICVVVAIAFYFVFERNTTALRNFIKARMPKARAHAEAQA